MEAARDGQPNMPQVDGKAVLSDAAHRDPYLQLLSKIEHHLDEIAEILGGGHNVDSQCAVLTVQETAELLRVSPDAIYDMCPRPGFPAKKVGGQWRIPVMGLRSWLGEQPSTQGDNDKWFPYGPLE